MTRPRPWLLFALSITSAIACSDSEAPPPRATALRPGEVCDPQGSTDLKLRFDPPVVVIAERASRPAKLVVEPDLCEPMTAKFSAAGANVDAPPDAKLDLRHATHEISLRGKAVGRSAITATIVRPADGQTASATLEVDVRTAEVPVCRAAAIAPAPFDAAHETVTGQGDLSSASVSAPKAAFERTDFWGLSKMSVTIGCDEGSLVADAGLPLSALGPAVTFTASGIPMRSLRREVTFAIPVNPAAMPERARLRHVHVLYRSPLAKKARVVAVRDPSFVKRGDGWVMTFSAPFFGTYQAAVGSDAGTKKRKRRITHRALFGFSMGGGGAASLGLRHHARFDAIGALGGASDWTWMLHYVTDYLMGGFCPASKPDCPVVAPDAYPNDEPFVHTGDFNHFWYEEGAGNGGGFSRASYGNLFTDLSVMLGSPNGQNAELWHLAPGPKPTDPWVTGNVTDLPPNVDCTFTVAPGSTDDPAKWQAIEDRCRRGRCDPKNAWIAPTGYYDDEYNPDGSRQVISVCDGAQNGTSPYVDTWAPPGSGQAAPVNFALAVDINKNGVRDQNEPIIRRSGHEPYDDVGEDGLASDREPGFDPIANPDPNQDDYDAQIRPDGTERNFRFDPGEPYRDDGYDGVPNTKSVHVAGDPGEGDGVFTETAALRAFRSNDGKALIRRWVDPPSGPFDDAALLRFDILSDGGVRDLFNFGAVARHFSGALGARRGPDGLPLRAHAFYGNFDTLPGQKPGGPFSPAEMLWDDLSTMPSVQYGSIDATPQDIQEGDGQHVGSGTQLLSRVQLAFYSMARTWADADARRTDSSSVQPMTKTVSELGIDCELAGRCQTWFKGPRTGRGGPIALTLPPGYANENNQSLRYPVVYVMHGYGMDPRDIEALALVTTSFMNDARRSYATRLPKFITVYLDGRCRVAENGAPECLSGSFYLNSTRPGGPQIEDWVLEVMDWVDRNYRTMPATELEVTE